MCKLLLSRHVPFQLIGISCIQFDDTRIVSGSWDKSIKVLYLVFRKLKVGYILLYTLIRYGIEELTLHGQL